MSAPLDIGDHVTLDGNRSDVRSVIARRHGLSPGLMQYRLMPATDGWVAGERLRHVEGYSHRECDLENDA